MSPASSSLQGSFSAGGHPLGPMSFSGADAAGAFAPLHPGGSLHYALARKAAQPGRSQPPPPADSSRARTSVKARVGLPSRFEAPGLPPAPTR